MSVASLLRFINTNIKLALNSHGFTRICNLSNNDDAVLEMKRSFLGK